MLYIVYQTRFVSPVSQFYSLFSNYYFFKCWFQAYVTFHSYGQYILYPWGYDRKVPPDYADLDRVGRKAAAAIKATGGPSYTVGSSAATLYAASGKYAKYDMKINNYVQN